MTKRQPAGKKTVRRVTGHKHRRRAEKSIRRVDPSQRGVQIRDSESSPRGAEAFRASLGRTEAHRLQQGVAQRKARLAEHPWWKEVDGRADAILSGGKIRLFWWHDYKLRGSNFGDALSPVIVEKLARKKTRRTDASPKLIAVGSVAKFGKAGDQLWGCGFPMAGQSCAPGVQVHAVRGPHTRAQLLQQGIACPEVYGDPALLLPHLFDLSGIEKKHEVGVVPHFVDWQRARGLLQGRSAKLIDILAPVEQVIRDIASSKIVYSSSLHGVIAAEALGVPAVWVEFSDGVRGGGWKFGDYYAVTGRSVTVKDWRRGVDWKGSAPEIKIPDLEPLYEAFPFRPPGATLASLSLIAL